MRLFLVISQPFLGGLHFLQGICMHPKENWCKGGWHHTFSKLNILSKKISFTFWIIYFAKKCSNFSSLLLP